jgi:hypothetical protein
MTTFEKQQSSGVFIEAGKIAFSMNIPITGNPYQDQPYRNLWEKGHRAAFRKFDQKRSVRRGR